MLVFVLVAIFVLICTATLHYKLHFIFRIRSCYRLDSSSTLPTSAPSLQAVRTRSASLVSMNIRRQCCCVLNGVDGQNFDFFPISFMFYVLFLIFMCVLICINESLNYLTSIDSEETIIDLLFGLPIKSYHDHSLFELHKIHLYQGELPIIYVLDLALVCGIMLISIWESLFSFYRYYTTFQAMQAVEVSSSSVIKRFVIYAIIYSTVFIVEIAVYYYVFLIVVLLHLSFNIYCTWKFATLLIEEYKLFISIGMEEHCEVISGKKNQEILNSVIFMKRTSIACCILQSISLCLFVVVYEPKIIYFLPILWSISCSIFALNFIRNRIFLRRQIFRINQQIKYNCFCCETQRKITSKQTASPKHQAQKSKSNKANDIQEAMLSDSDAADDADDANKITAPQSMLETRSKSATDLKQKSKPHLASTASEPTVFKHITEQKADDKDLNIAIPNEEIAHKEVHEQKHNSPTFSRGGAEYSYSATNRPKKTKKALALLGIHEAEPTTGSMQMQLGNIDVLQTQTSISKSRSHKKITVTPIEVAHKDMDSSTERTEPLELCKVASGSDDERYDAHNVPAPAQGAMSETPDLGEAIKSFKLFAKYGFLSNANINSAQQLQNYHAQQMSAHAQTYSVDLQYIHRINVQKEIQQHKLQISDATMLTKAHSLPKKKIDQTTLR